MYHYRTFPLNHLRSLLFVVLLMVGLVLAACAGAPPTAQQPTGDLVAIWAGKVEGTDAFIGIVSNGKDVMAYVCDGKTISQWFQGQVNGDKLDLSAGNAKLQTQLTRDTTSGSVTLANGQFKFTATRTTGDAGLYRSDETINNEKWVGGWIVLNDGQLRGANVQQTTGRIVTQTALTNVARLIKPQLDLY